MSGAHFHRTIGLHEATRTARARSLFIDARGVLGALERARAIERLDSKLWRGVRVYRVTCEGPYGRGPHDQYVPIGVLWSLLDLQHFLCPFHR